MSGSGHRDVTFADAFAAAVALQKGGDTAAAAARYEHLLTVQPENPNVWHNLGVCLRQLGHVEAAVGSLTRAATLAPLQADFHSSLGVALREGDELEAARAAHARAHTLAPHDERVRRNFAVCLRDLGELDEALALFDALQAEAPDDPYLTWERGVVHMQRGDLVAGWAMLESRFRHREVVPTIRQPRWAGEDLQGRTLLVVGEQGYGDTLFASRYLPRLAGRAARVLFACKRELRALFEGTPGVDELIDPAATSTRFDCWVSIMSLPHLCGDEARPIPPPARLSTPPAPPPAVQALLARAGARRKVGIVWSGSVTFKDNRRRAATLDQFLPLARVPGVQLVSLQKGPRLAELDAAGARSLVLDAGSLLDDFAATAATLRALDLIIMTDSAVAHLAGALDVPVWNLLNFAPYWLYGREGEACSWYPSWRFFRQPRAGDWNDVFTRVAAALAADVSVPTRNA